MSTQDQKTILLVEDQPGTVLVVTKQLRRFGYSVIAASTGEEAVDIATGDTQLDRKSAWHRTLRLRAEKLR